MRERLLAAEQVVGFVWREGALHVLDQRRLPGEQVWHACHTVSAVATMLAGGALQGAAAREICCGYALVLGARQRMTEGGDWRAGLQVDIDALCAAGLPAAEGARLLAAMHQRLALMKPGAQPLAVLEDEACGAQQRDREANLAMAQLGVELIRGFQGNLQNLLSIGCAGALASGGIGTALGVVRAAQLEGLLERCYLGESRPQLQGARLAAWELSQEGIAVALSADAALAHVMKVRGVTWAVVGAERIAANGDVLGVIGTYQLAVAAMHHGVRLMVVAPSAVIDLAAESGEEDFHELGDGPLAYAGTERVDGVDEVAPQYDVTPADLVDFLVTERGVVERPDAAKLTQLMCRRRLH
ncbi:s-methyl-5-thioribose-1-phosphate isomerase [Pseudomonas argentinensis]|uniref:Methylthioribose-1-phosphate isomerase n=1 Tax=Phytopseudomonas argentinensis TaxID=289370 RepID=A0A1I3L4A1_9GAMM|nr:s-methyl-5-thioribose-1-phosphate isomerase [Pseudomonas argentinensis]KAB0550239.1 s-methyl-5-thioribose-1-phosphate isomerase [Pseudomonas argentinensis]SFI79265.1 methylthioribose-1-phosphate isomerase [Pseudomonas argentinensis]